MPPMPCPERLALSKRVSDAIKSVYRAKHDYDAADRKITLTELAELETALSAARTIESEAVHAFQGHFKECFFGIKSR